MTFNRNVEKSASAAYETMKSTNRGFYKEKPNQHQYPDNYSTSISSAHKVTAYNNRYSGNKNRKITSAKSSAVPITLSSPQPGFPASRQADSPPHQNISLSSINVSEKFVSYIQDLGIAVNMRSHKALKSTVIQRNHLFNTSGAAQ